MKLYIDHGQKSVQTFSALEKQTTLYYQITIQISSKSKSYSTIPVKMLSTAWNRYFQLTESLKFWYLITALNFHQDYSKILQQNGVSSTRPHHPTTPNQMEKQKIRSKRRRSYFEKLMKMVKTSNWVCWRGETPPQKGSHRHQPSDFWGVGRSPPSPSTQRSLQNGIKTKKPRRCRRRNGNNNGTMIEAQKNWPNSKLEM